MGATLFNNGDLTIYSGNVVITNGAAASNHSGVFNSLGGLFIKLT